MGTFSKILSYDSIIERKLNVFLTKRLIAERSSYQVSVNEKNNLSVQYNLKVASTLTSLCDPLFQTFGLSTFGYKRIFKDGRYLFLSTNNEWQSYHLYHIHNHGNFFKNAMAECSSSREDSFYRTFWPSLSSDHFLQSLNHFDMWNGINFYRKKEDSIELWTFSTNAEQHQNPNSYLEMLNHLEHFIAFFNVKACDIIDVSDQKKLARFKDGLDLVLPESCDFTPHNKNLFLDATKIDRIPLMVGSRFVHLSKRQTECVKLVSYGKSIKEVARLLKISPRTVETFLGSVKCKTGYATMSEVISCFHHSCALIGLK